MPDRRPDPRGGLALYEPPFRTGRMALGGVEEENEVIYAHKRPT